VIFRVQHGIALHTEADDSTRIRLLADDANDDRMAIGEHLDARARRCRRSLDRIRLSKVLDCLSRLPHGFRQVSVDEDLRG